jgi:hypothetical protein
MTTKWALLETIQREPDNQVACYTMADLLEEEGWPQRAFCYRWMGWYGMRPGERQGKHLRKRFVWYKEGAFFGFLDPEEERYNSLPHARLPALLFEALDANHPEHQLYATWQQAVKDLEKALTQVRALVLHPGERRER